MTGAFDGHFYRVQGSPLVEDIAYTFAGGPIHGTGRKQGAVVLREIVSLPDPHTLNLAMTIFMGRKELPLGNAAFPASVKEIACASVLISPLAVNGDLRKPVKLTRNARSLSGRAPAEILLSKNESPWPERVR